MLFLDAGAILRPEIVPNSIDGFKFAEGPISNREQRGPSRPQSPRVPFNFTS